MENIRKIGFHSWKMMMFNLRFSDDILMQIAFVGTNQGVRDWFEAGIDYAIKRMKKVASGEEKFMDEFNVCKRLQKSSKQKKIKKKVIEQSYFL